MNGASCFILSQEFLVHIFWFHFVSSLFLGGGNATCVPVRMVARMADVEEMCSSVAVGGSGGVAEFHRRAGTNEEDPLVFLLYGTRGQCG